MLRQRTLLALICPGLASFALAACSDGSDEELGLEQQALTETKTFQEGISSYTGTTDTYIKQGSSASSNFGSVTTCHVDGDDGSGVDKSCLMRWALTGVPADAVVTSASITLRALDAGDTYQVYRLLRSFNESQATWNNAASGSAWATAGALAATDRGAQVGSVGGSSGSKTITLNAAGIAMVQSWIDDAANNKGIVIANTSSSGGIDFASSEYATASDRPKLSITYNTVSGGAGGSGGSGGTSGAGASGGGAAGGGGTAGTAPEANVLIAFMGDQGDNSNGDAVLTLIKNEGARAVVHNGDFDYGSNPTNFENRINRVLGANFPYYAVIGNHDASAWSGYSANQVARAARVPSMSCTGELGVKANCNFKGVHLIESCIGVSELRSTCGANAADQVSFIQSSLAASSAPFKICNWHKNQHDMQTGSKTNEVGWQAYQACMNAGAIVATGHEHSYERTGILTNIGNATNHGIVSGGYATMSISPGRSFVLVSGLGGVEIRDFEAASHNDDTWWATTYSSNRWLKNGVTQTLGTPSYGALFVRFHDGGNPKRAVAYFKDLNGRLIDEFVINVP
jgi:predicted phosphodiesterase